MKLGLFLLRAAFALLLAIGPSQSATLPIDIGYEPRLELSGLAEIFVDESGVLDAQAVAALTHQFRAVSPNDLKRRYDSRVFWLRATLHNASGEKIERWLSVGHARIESATLFQRDAQGWRGVETGLLVPLKNKPVNATGLVLPLTLKSGESRQILLRVQSRTVLDLNSRLWQPVAFLQADDRRQLMVAAGAGGSLIVAFISLSVFARLRQRTYLYFSLLHLSTMLMEVGREGLWERYLWPATMAFPIHLHVVVGTTAAVVLILIQRDFLDLRVTYPRWDRVLLGFVSLTLAISLISAFSYGMWNEVWSRALLLLVVVSLWVAVMAWRQGSKTAGYLALGYSVAWVVEGLRAASNLGLLHLPFTHYTNLTWALLVAAPMFFLALSEQSRRLHAQLEQSKQSNRAKSDFLARVSHELHAPLNTIIGYARMLRRGSVRLSLQEGTSDIERNGLRLLAMIDELLDQSRLDSGQLVLHSQPLALIPWLSEIERSGKIQAEAAGNVFTLNRQGDLPPALLLDGPRLRQVLDNLISNANRYTKDGRIELGCKASKAEANGKIRLHFWVMDTGYGIARDEQQKIFGAFYQGKSAPSRTERRRAGVGLGLSIASDLVKLLGGKLVVQSTVGVGSTFNFDLECPTYTESLAPFAKEVHTTQTAAPEFVGLRVLLADDDTLAQRLLVDLLETLGCHVDCVSSGQAAIGKLLKNPSYFDLVITDQVMVDGDGWAVLDFARRQGPGLPVILISAMRKLRPVEAAPDIDFDAFLGKPVQISELSGALATLRSTQLKQTAQNALIRPGANQLNDLLALVRLGEVSAIEDWCAALRASQPEHADYAQQVQQAARLLDFSALKRLASKPNT